MQNPIIELDAPTRLVEICMLGSDVVHTYQRSVIRRASFKSKRSLDSVTEVSYD